MSNARIIAEYVNEVSEEQSQTYLVNRTFTHLCNVSGGPGLGSSIEFSLGGTSANTVAFCTGQAATGHTGDIAVATFMSLSYTASKIKIVSNGNDNFSFYLAINSFNNQSTPIKFTVRPLGREVIDMNPGSAYSSGYMIHDAGLMTSTSTGTYTAGAGPATGW
jgi:hypothetical protein